MRSFFSVLAVFFFLYIAVAISFAAIEPGEVIQKLVADIDGNGKMEIIAIRKCKPPATFERVEILKNEGTNRPIFASEWKEIEDGLLLSSKGHLKLEKIGSRILAKYIWRRRGEGTGAGHEYEHITYYGFVGGKIGPVFEYTAKDSHWGKSKFGQAGYLDETAGTVSLKDIDGDGDADILLLVKQNKIQEGKDNKGISTWTTNITQKILRYDWKEPQGFALVGEEEKIK